MFPKMVPTADLTDRQWDMREAAKSQIWTPPPEVRVVVPQILREIPVADTPVEVPAAAQPHVTQEQISDWIGHGRSQKRPWSVLMDIFKSRTSLTDLVTMIWADIHGDNVSVPGKVVLIVRPRNDDQQWVAEHFSIIAYSSEMLSSIPHYYGLVVLEQNSNGEFQPVRGTQGAGTRSLMESWIAANAVFEVKPEHREFIRVMLGARGNRVEGQKIMTWDALKDMIEATAKDLIPNLTSYQEVIDPEVDVFPDTPVLSALRLQNNAHALRLLTPEEAEKQLDSYSQVWLKKLGICRYWVAHTQGTSARGLAFRWVAGMGHPVTDPLERQMVASIWQPRAGENDTDTQHASEIGWQGWMEYLFKQGAQLGERFEWMRIAAQGPDENWDDELEDDRLKEPNQRRYAIRFKAETEGTQTYLTHLSFHVLQDSDLKPSRNYGDIYWQSTDGHLELESIRGTKSFDVAEMWLKGMGLQYKFPADRKIVAGMLQFQLEDDGSKVLWKDIKSMVSGGWSTFSHLRRNYEVVHGKKSPETLVWVMRRKGEGENAVKQFSILTEAETQERYGHELSVLRIKFSRPKGTEEEHVEVMRGIGSPELKKMLNHRVAVFAPDATRLEEESRRFAPQSEIFGSTENSCKSEPLFTPAELMKTPALVRPSDAPKIETNAPGFHILRPDEIDVTKLLPSDTIPVMTDSAAATLMAMIMGAMAVRYFGPALLRFSAPQPASGGGFLSPRNRLENEGT